MEIKLADLPKSEFRISIKEDIIKSILNNIKIKGKNLYKEFSKLKSQEDKKLGSIKKDFLSNWKNGKRIPIDCFEFLCNLYNKDIIYYQKDVYELLLKSSRNAWKTKFPIKIDKNLFLISEAIRTEGCIVKGRKNYVQGIEISNKDLYLLKTIEKTFNKLNINSSFSRILNIIVYLDENEVTKIVDKENNKELHFFFNNGRLIFMEQVKNYEFEKNYVVHFENKIKDLSVKASDKNIISIQSDLKATSYLKLQVYNSVFAKLISYYFKIPYGIGNQKTYTIDFPFNINKLSNNILKTILNIVICCEGCIFYKGKDRHLYIKIASEKYLEKLQLMFKRFNIESKIVKSTEEKLYILIIRRRYNFERLFSLFKLIVQYKQDNLKQIIDSYLINRMPHNKATLNYLIILKQLEPTTIKNVSEIMNKKYTTIMATFNLLEKEGYISKYGRKFLGTKTTPWIYKISDKGLNFIYEDK